jgi:hypothetical protein
MNLQVKKPFLKKQLDLHKLSHGRRQPTRPPQVPHRDGGSGQMVPLRVCHRLLRLRGLPSSSLPRLPFPMAAPQPGCKTLRPSISSRKPQPPHSLLLLLPPYPSLPLRVLIVCCSLRSVSRRPGDQAVQGNGHGRGGSAGLGGVLRDEGRVRQPRRVPQRAGKCLRPPPCFLVSRPLPGRSCRCSRWG